MTQDIKRKSGRQGKIWIFLLYGETGFDFKRDCQPKCDETSL